MKIMSVLLATFVSLQLFANISSTTLYDGLVERLDTFKITVDPRLAPPHFSKESGKILKAVCGELSLSEGDKCIFLVKKAEYRKSIYIVDLDIVADNNDLDN